MAQDGAIGVRLRGVAKRYGEQVALHPTDLEVEPRTCLAVIGPSGCGKSTLLRIVVGLVAPDAGEVALGEETLAPSSRRRLRQRIGYVIQEGGLFPHLTAAENASLAARDQGWAGDRIGARLGELAALTRLDPSLLGRYPAELSGGQRQRVGLVRALMLDPDVLLMDEPLAALDPMIRSRLQEDLRSVIRRLRKTVLLVTHDLAEAAYLGDEIALFRAGRLVQRGTHAALAERPAEPFVAEFLRAQRALHEVEPQGSA